MKRPLVAVSVMLLSLVASCAIEDGEESEQELIDSDELAAAGEGKADAPTDFTRLEAASADQVATAFADRLGPALEECFAAYQRVMDADATLLTEAVAGSFLQVYTRTGGRSCTEWSDLDETVTAVLTAEGVTEMAPTALIGAMKAWAEARLHLGRDGVVLDRDTPTMLFADLWRVEDANAAARMRAPAGIDMAALRAQWDQVRASTTLDRDFLNPVTFPPGVLTGPSSTLFRYLRAAFPLRSLRYVASGRDAVAAFAASGEGPDGEATFDPIATALRKSSIKRRYYFARVGEWSSNVLIVIDRHGQAWGMQMGYSE